MATVPHRVASLESTVSDHKARIGVIENDLKHGSNVFTNVEEKIDTLSNALVKHMEKEEGRRFKIGMVIILSMAGTIATMGAYIFKTGVGV